MKASKNSPLFGIALLCGLLHLVAAGQSPAEEFAGAYWLTDDTTVTIENQEGGWHLRLRDEDAHRMEAAGDNRWKVPGLDLEVSKSGSSLTLSRYGETVLLPRLEAEKPVDEEAPLSDLISALAPRLMMAWHVPGVSVALVGAGEVTWLGQFGIKSHGREERVDAETIFEAASMSKPFFAYVVLQLVEEGLIDLDTPLIEYLGGPYLEDEPLHQQITTRMVLAHTSGFPNWRPGGWRRDGPLPIHFEPGTSMRYSGEGFLFLQRALEPLTGISTEELTRTRLLKPLGMTHSSYVWQDAYDSKAAAGHTAEGLLPERQRSIYHTANTAFTLYTTAADYALFLIEMMNEDRTAPHSLSTTMLQEMLAIQSDVHGRSPIIRKGGNGEGTVHFGLGWRVDALPGGDRYCHSGSNGTGFRCYSEFNPATGNGIVIMTNAVGGRNVWEGLMREVGEE